MKKLSRKNTLILFSLILTFTINIFCFYSIYPKNDKVPLKMLVLIPEKKDDHSFSQAAYEGLLDLDKKKYFIAYIDNAEHIDERELIIRATQYYQNGFTVFVGVGAEFSELITQLAKKNHQAHYATISGWANGDNVANYCLDCIPLGGCLAAAGASVLTRTNIVGFVGGLRTVDGDEAIQFAKSLKKFSPQIHCIVNWTENWSDIQLAKELSLKQIKEGADVVIAGANIGTVIAAKESKKSLVIGWMSNPSSLGKNVVALSVDINMNKLYQKLLSTIENGQFIAGRTIITKTDNVWNISNINSDIITKDAALLIENRISSC